MQKVAPSKTVYCYYFPEVRDVVTKAANPYPHDIFLQSLDPGLDHFHEPIIEKYLAHMKEQMPGLDTYPERYTAHGASESIFHILADIAAKEKNTPLYILEGEYEGYAGYGQNLGLAFTPVSYESNFSTLPKGIFFISNPSARDGNIVPNEKIAEIGDAGHAIILDCSYVGFTTPHEFLVTHPRIRAVLVSLSKPFGLYYYRIGFCFMRRDMKTLEVNKWFKNIFSHIVADRVLSTFTASALAEKYKPQQQRAVERLSEDLGFRVHASDVTILAHISESEVPPEAKDKIAEFKRGDRYRFGLTAYFLAQES
jgi:histidinol-phosphate/aromatic aminotransferase/cobyric acid decarboxylase-like protein